MMPPMTYGKPLPPRKHSRKKDLWLSYIGSAIILFLIAYSIWHEILADGELLK